MCEDMRNHKYYVDMSAEITGPAVNDTRLSTRAYTGWVRRRSWVQNPCWPDCVHMCSVINGHIHHASLAVPDASDMPFTSAYVIWVRRLGSTSKIRSRTGECRDDAVTDVVTDAVTDVVLQPTTPRCPKARDMW